MTVGIALRRAALALCFPLALVALAEGIARLVSEPPEGSRLFTVFTGSNGEPFWQRNPTRPKSWQPAYPEAKREGWIRVVCIGGSTVEGQPIPEMAFPIVLQSLLSELKTGEHVEVIGAGLGGQYSAGEVAVLHEVLDLKPDIIVLYSAHNEFHTTNVDTLLRQHEHPILAKLAGVVANLRLRTLLMRALNRETVTIETDPSIKDKPPDHRPIDGPEYGLVVSKFRERLNEFVEVCDAHDIALVMCTSVSNLLDFPPMADVYRSDLSAADRATEAALIKSSLAASSTRDFARGLDLAEQAAKIDPTPATVNYARGRALYGLKRIDEAKEQLRLARDNDGRAHRATTELNAVVREVADQTSALLADVEQRFAEVSPDGLVGNQWIVDNVHPTVDGQALIARVVIETLGRANNLITQSDIKRLPSLSHLTGQPSAADSEERIGFSNLLLALEQGRPGETADVARLHFENSLKTETRAGALLGIALLDALDGKAKQGAAGMQKAFATDPKVFSGYAESARKSVFVEKLFRQCGVKYEGDKPVIQR